VKAEEERVAKIRTMIDLIASNSNIEYDTPADKLQQRISTLVAITIGDSFQEFKIEAQQIQANILAHLYDALAKRQVYEKEQADQKAERERQEAVRKELEEKQKAIDAESKRLADEKASQEAERKRLHDEKIKSRSNTLSGLGLIYDGEQYAYMDVNVHWTEITTMDNNEFGSLIEKIKPIIAKRKEEEKIRLDKEKADREQKIKDDAEKAAREKLEKEAKDAADKKAREEAEKARQDALKPDKDKLLTYADSIELLPFPGLFNQASNDVVDRVRASLTRIANQIRKEAREL